MLETAEIGSKVEKEAYEKEALAIREGLLNAQRDIARLKVPVIIVVSGNEGAGKGELVNLLNEWMDARGIQTYAFWNPSDEEQERPRFWRFWRVLPAKGRMGIFFGSWYTDPIIQRVFKEIDDDRFNLELERIRSFERMLVSEGALILKFWLHLSKSAQKKRLKDLEKDPATAWKVSKTDWGFFKKYGRFRKVSEHALQETNTAEAAWNIVEAVDKRYRQLTVARTILQAVRDRCLQVAESGGGSAPGKRVQPVPKKVNVINQMDMSKKVSAKDYEARLPKLQGRLNLLTRDLYRSKRSIVLVFEGNDAAGKGGAIRRVTQGMDARAYRLIPIAAPTDEERAQPYLWRFWRHLPRLGRLTLFDRSWYGRVLVERIEGFCPDADWKRAYLEINEFEEQLTDFGTVVLKFWLSINKEEQLRRFKERETTSYKKYKITEEDWRNREKWDAYEAAVCDMVEKTSTPAAPWVLVEANDKRHARLKVLKAICDRLEKDS